MEILPAIDLKDGVAVRLTHGLMDTAKIYSNEPFEVAKKFEKMGSKWLHLVDLNGAFAGEDTIRRYCDLGVDRVILGSIALKNPEFVKQMSKNYSIAVGIDAIDGYVAVEGWAQKSTMKATDLAQEFANAGVEAIICTDVGRDGTLSGVNVDFTLEIARASGVDTIASGGVKDINDIKLLLETKEVAGVIVGKAYYEGTLDLEAAFNLS